MEISLMGALITFQVTFTEFFIAATVFVAIGMRYGWRSAMLGCILGFAGIAVVAVVLKETLQYLTFTALDYISAVLLLSFGAYLFYEFFTAHKKGEGVQTIDRNIENESKFHLKGVTVCAWGVFAEGLEVLVVWLAIALRQCYPTASAGVGIGLFVVVAAGLLFGRFRVFERVPPKYLDCAASIMVTLYGLYFLKEAVEASLA